MPIDLAALGRRLREARQHLGITQEAAAMAIGVPRTAVIHIEAGSRSLSTTELAELAKLYRCPAASFLAEPLPEEEDILVALHRLSPEYEDDPEVSRQVARCVEICHEASHLAGLLGRSSRRSPPAYELAAPSGFSEAARQGARMAAEERKRLGIGQAPIPDMASLLAGQGVWACGAKLPDGMSGLFLHHPSFGTAVLVNYNHLRARKRFSYAHEYAHALMDRGRGVAITTQRNANDLIEKRANAFAAALLMPKTGVEAFLTALDKGASSRQVFHVYDATTEEGVEAQGRSAPGSQDITFQDVAEQAHHFRVGYEVAAYRLCELGFVSREELKVLLNKKQQAHAYLRLVGKYDDIQGKPAPGDTELIRQVVPLAIEAFRRQVIRREQLLSLGARLGLQGEALADLAGS